MLAVVRDALTVYCGIPKKDIATAPDGKEALRACGAGHPPDIVITDLRMPTLPGEEFIRMLRERAVPCDVIVLTGYADLNTALALYRYEVSEVIQKPFDPKHLAAAVRRLVSRLEMKRQNEDFRGRLLQSEKLASIGLLASGVAHEINNPNTFIRGNLELLSRHFQKAKDARGSGPAEVDIEDLIRSCIEGTERISKITSSLLLFSRVNAGERRPFSIAKLIDGALAMLRHRLVGVQVATSLPGALKETVGREGEILQVLTNLIVNAVDAFEGSAVDPSKRRIELKVWDDALNRRQIVAVTDNGCGMTPEVMGRMFDPFFTTKDVGKGTGLGLSISRGIIHSHCGVMTCTSKPGEGTSIRFELPWAEGQ